MGLTSGRAAATSLPPSLSPTHPVDGAQTSYPISIQFAGGVRNRGNGKLLLLPTVFTDRDRGVAALLRHHA
jgi:hypothetical protein